MRQELKHENRCWCVLGSNTSNICHCLVMVFAWWIYIYIYFPWHPCFAQFNVMSQCRLWRSCVMPSPYVGREWPLRKQKKCNANDPTSIAKVAEGSIILPHSPGTAGTKQEVTLWCKESKAGLVGRPIIDIIWKALNGPGASMGVAWESELSWFSLESLKVRSSTWSPLVLPACGLEVAMMSRNTSFPQ